MAGSGLESESRAGIGGTSPWAALISSAGGLRLGEPVILTNEWAMRPFFICGGQNAPGSEDAQTDASRRGRSDGL